MSWSPLRPEPSWSVPIAVADNHLPGTDAASWFTARPRSGAIASAGVVLALALGYLAIRDPRYAVALAAGVAVIAFVVIRPLFGALALVALVPALSGIAPGFPVPNLRISELLIGSIGVTLLVVARRSMAAPWGTLDWFLLGYGVLWTLDGVYGAVTSHEHLSVGSWGTVAGQLQFFLLYRSLKVTLRTTQERHLALRALFVGGGFVAAVAVLQEAHAPGVISLLVTLTGSAGGQSGSILRATGPFFNWAALAGYLLPLVLIATCLGMARSEWSKKRSNVALVLLLILALLFTAELSVILSLLVGVCVLGVRYGRGKVVLRWLGIGLVVFGIGAGSLLRDRLGQQFSASAGTGRPAWLPQTLGFRWVVWTHQYIPAIRGKPLTGYGVVLPSSIQWPFSESQYITFLIQGGAPLVAMFGLLAWAMILEAKRARRSADMTDRALGEALLITVIALTVINFIWPYLSNGGMPQILWCLFAILPPAVMRAKSKGVWLDDRSLLEVPLDSTESGHPRVLNLSA
jgi:hypothetical protein